MEISLNEAIRLLQHGEVVAVPTETVYGLAASLNQPQAIEKIFSLKGRPKTNPLIIHVASQDRILDYFDPNALPPYFNQLAESFWPGPLTLILGIRSHLVSPLVTAGLSTAGFRVPAHPLALDLLKEVGPLVMPSANLSGRPSATTPQHVQEDFGHSFPVLNGGACAKGLESTILYFQDPKWVIVRLGSLPPEAFQEILAYQPKIVAKTSVENPLCPGQLFRHYAPQAKLILGLGFPKDKILPTFVLGFKERNYGKGQRVILLGSLSKPQEVAENLYKALRQLDQEKAEIAWVDINFPQTGLWLTIAERLRRASEK